MSGERYIGDYRLLKPLGKGGAARVWLAEHVPTGERVALKVLTADDGDLDLGDGPRLEDRFRTEAEILAGFSHPGLVRVLDIIDERPSGPLAYAMEYTPGHTLRDLEAELDAATLLRIHEQVAQTLAYVHGLDVLHRDVKATNVLVSEPDARGQRAVKLIDFGIAKDRAIEAQTRVGVIVGTMASMAPETFDRHCGGAVALTSAVDQWGLGVMLFRALSGKLPFGGQSFEALLDEIRNRPAPALTTRPNYVLGPAFADVQSILRRLLAKDPSRRFTSMLEVAHALGDIADRLEAPEDHHIRFEDDPSQLATEIAAGLSPVGAPADPRPSLAAGLVALPNPHDIVDIPVTRDTVIDTEPPEAVRDLASPLAVTVLYPPDPAETPRRLPEVCRSQHDLPAASADSEAIQVAPVPVPVPARPPAPTEPVLERAFPAPPPPGSITIPEWQRTAFFATATVLVAIIAYLLGRLS